MNAHANLNLRHLGLVMRPFRVGVLNLNYRPLDLYACHMLSFFFFFFFTTKSQSLH